MSVWGLSAGWLILEHSEVAPSPCPKLGLSIPISTMGIRKIPTLQSELSNTTS